MTDGRRRERRRALPPRALSVLAAAGALLVGAALAVASAPPAAAAPVSGTTALVADGSGAGLLDPSERLVPGAVTQRCTVVETLASTTADTVRLSAQGVGGPLAGHLLVVVEVGTGGSRRSCEGFSGATVFSGSLASMARATERGGLDTGWRAVRGEPRTFQFSFSLAASAPQGSTASGEFVWLGTADGGAAPPAGSSGDDGAPRPGSGGPGGSGVGGTGPEGGSDDPVPPTRPPADGAPAPSGPAPPDRPAPASAAPDGADAPRPADARGAQDAPSAPDRADVQLDVPGGGLLDVPGGGVLDLSRAPEALAALVESPAIPVAVLAAVALFLLVQHHLDASDPKLALAPVRPAHLPFTHPLDDDGDRP